MHSQQLHSDLPVLLSIAGHDPSGGAGIQADLESAAAFGVQGLSIISCLTVQNSANVRRLQPVELELIAAQLDCLLEDMPIHGLKLGLLGSVGLIDWLGQQLAQARLPTPVLDPVLAAGGGLELSDAELIAALRRLLPQVRLLTPNLPEAQRLSGQQELADCAAALCQLGAEAVLISGGHNPDTELVNRLYDASGLIQEWAWPRLPGAYHGSGCTLAAASAALLAKGCDLIIALEQAQQFTWNSLAQARRIGQHQLNPGRYGA
jgi:hydroxymethylpyrimidine/phosphomethylpyrimidine kinase